jgi:hypothetical protein
MEVMGTIPIRQEHIGQQNWQNVVVLLADQDEVVDRQGCDLDRLIDQMQSKCLNPVQCNHSSAASSGNTVTDIGRKLSFKLTALTGRG